MQGPHDVTDEVCKGEIDPELAKRRQDRKDR